MENLLTTDGPKGRVVSAISIAWIITTIVLMCNLPARAQFKITGAAVIVATEKPGLALEAQAGYQFKNWQVQSGILARGIQPPTWFGISGGPVLRVDENWNLQPYLGVNYKKLGNKSTQDRYVHNNVTEVLRDNIETDSFAGSIGLQVIRKSLYINAGWFVQNGDSPKYYLTVGIQHIFGHE